MRDWYIREIVEPGKQPLVLLFVAFVLTFLIIRFSVRMIRAGVSWWPGNMSRGGVHLHHVVFGVIFVLVAGVGAFTPAGGRRPWAEILAAIFGAGAALVLDEFALILHLRDVYWEEQGRTSVNAVFLAVALIGLLVIGVTPLSAGGAESTTAAAYLVATVPNAILVVITLLKGKIWTGLIGILIPFLVLVGAVRLARPGSPWARWRYRKGTKKFRRAARREEHVHAGWVRLRNRIQDAVAGKPD